MRCPRVDVCDGAGFLADFLAKHEPPPQLASELRLHTTTAQAAPASAAQVNFTPPVTTRNTVSLL